MRQLPYFLRQALRGIQAGPFVQLAATGTLTVTLVLLGGVALLVLNVGRLTHHWGAGTQLSVALRSGTGDERAAALERLLAGRPEVESVRRVTSAEAFARLKQSLGPRAELLSEVDPAFLPASLEVRLQPGLDRERLQPLLAVLSSAPGVAEVDYLGQWADKLGTLAGLVRHAGLVLALLVMAACLYVVATTIRLGVYARRDAVEIQKLVGATDGFVRMPFLIEGALQGLCAALLAWGVLFAFFRSAAPRVAEALGALVSHTPLAFFGAPELLVGIGGAALLGVLGSGLAVGRHLEV
ncbi:MAG: ABC transporter permease [Deltaproteobacteria bacterium]|nr:ABC transporter permease [Deltaproteobacteria bacterium]